MSTKISVGLEHSKKSCARLLEQEVFSAKLKRGSVLEKQARALANNKMKQKLQEVQELSNKYIELGEFKKYSCVHID